MDTFAGQLPPSELGFDRVTGAGVTRVTVTGEIDATNGDRFHQTLMDALNESGLRRLVLDLGPLRFMDSNAVAVLMKAQRASDERGVSFGITNTSDPIRHVLQMLGVYDVLADAQGG